MLSSWCITLRFVTQLHVHVSGYEFCQKATKTSKTTCVQVLLLQLVVVTNALEPLSLFHSIHSYNTLAVRLQYAMLSSKATCDAVRHSIANSIVWRAIRITRVEQVILSIMIPHEGRFHDTPFPRLIILDQHLWIPCKLTSNEKRISSSSKY